MQGEERWGGEEEEWWRMMGGEGVLAAYNDCPEQTERGLVQLGAGSKGADETGGWPGKGRGLRRSPHGGELISP